MYKFIAGNKIRFLDDILTFLEDGVEQKDEDVITLKVCYNEYKDKILGKMHTLKPFLTEEKGKLFLRVALLHLEKEGLIQKYSNPSNIAVPIYLITYSGLILVKNGGYCKKLILDKLKEFLQRLAWFVTLLTLILNLYINKDKLISFSDTSTNHKTEVKDTLQKQTKKSKK
ncbi:hypothetical protein BWK60_10000 [Flavobacterium covae]|uniref:hypothetical protein n=1 Tax=Flavobacterium covae TaxID=2906076 RepID=UPI000B4C5AF8|nr:hypothetical protein [Flavobacterium covae]OWP86213.1 hypothetical protein BWK60_10000 [Flavobacterium covae]